MINFSKKILDSNKFRKPAIHFQDHGLYCFAPSGTTEYLDYWHSEEEKCINGYTAPDGDWISGYNYYYLNYCPILRLMEFAYKDRFGNIKKRREKTREFPDFYDYDYYYFQGIQEAEEEGKHMVALKARGKGYEQPYSEPVATPDGFREIGSLKEGDFVMNPDGNKTKVIQIHEHGVKDVYELMFDDGRTVRCGAEHLWQLTDMGTRDSKSIVKRTRDLFYGKLYNTYDGYNHYKYYIEPIEEIEYEEKEYNIDPYVLGVLIGDADTKSGTIRLSTKDDEIKDKVLSVLGDDYYLTRDYTTFNYTIAIKKESRFNEKNYMFDNYKYGVNPLRRYIDSLGLNVGCMDKFIPNEYKYGSIKQRYELVKGLMDTDGYCSKDGSIEFTNTSKRLVEDLAEVLRSLGIRCEIGTDKRIDKFCYRLYIRTNKNIFNLKRKLDRLNHTKKINSKVALIEIKLLDYQENSRCITVENSNHLYLTKGYIPTHNSFKGASMLTRNYYLIANSKSYAIASETEYLVRDGILSKAWDLMDFIDEHTAWSKKRSVNTKMHKRSGIIVTDEMGNKTEIGYKSEIIGVTLKNDPNKARGKRGKLILWEEGGSFKDILQAWQIARPSVEEDGVAFGLMCCFGTGGDDASKFDGLKELFYNPSGYNVKSFPNIWDDGAEGNSCGFFIPVYANMSVLGPDGVRSFMDISGNTYKDRSINYAMNERQKVIDGSSDSRAIDRYIAENPITPQEAVLELTGNIFPKKELMAQLAAIRTNKKLQSHKQVGNLNYINGVINWEIKKNGDITKYPLGRDDKHEGSIVIWEHPNIDTSGQLYIAGCLPPGEKVLTNHGLKDVEKVDHSDMLINENGKEVKIKVFQKRYKEDCDIYKITPHGSYRGTSFTGEHPILIEDQYVDAKDIKVGDRLKIPNKYAVYNEDYISKFYKYLGAEIDPNLIKLWWFLGVWTGDGFNNKNGNSHDIYVAFGIDQAKEAEQYDAVIKKVFNRKTVHCKWNGGNTRRFTHKGLYELLESEFGRYSYGKRIPGWIKTSRGDLRKFFIAGYLDSDGSVFYDRGSLRVNFTSVNLDLLEDLQDILYSYGIWNTITRHSKKGISIFKGKEYISKESYRLSIAKSSIYKLAPLGFDMVLYSRKVERIVLEKPGAVVKTGDKAVISSCGKYIYLKVAKIEKSKYTGTVYNFECETHTYMCRNITSHNCDPLIWRCGLISVRIEQNR